MQALQCQASFMVVFPALRALRFGQAYAAGKSFLQTGRPAKGGDSTNLPATATGGGSDDAGQTSVSHVDKTLPCAPVSGLQLNPHVMRS